MDLIKDINNKELSTVSDVSFTYKKTQRLATALYMVTGFMSDKEILKWELRDKGICLMSEIVLLVSKDNFFKHDSLERVNKFISEIISLLEISVSVKLISEMNFSILKSEYKELLEYVGVKENDILESNQKHFAENFFQVDEKKDKFPISPLGISEENNFYLNKKVVKPTFKNKPFDVSLRGKLGQNNFDKGQSKRHIRQDNDFLKNNMSDMNVLSKFEKNLSENISPNDFYKNQETTRGVAKNSREFKILKIIKDREDVSIKDISKIIDECSEKTIQRQLNTLLKKGVLKKEGERRWSKYSLM
ncbi:winged helix-turn-helix domain-containing protein [Patescibacteria group bacterium]